MKFDDFPTELKVLIISYFTPEERCSIIAPVSKQWHALAYDWCNWKSLHLKTRFGFRFKLGPAKFKGPDIKMILRHARPYQLNLYRYKFHAGFMGGFPICSSVRDLRLIHCHYPSEIGFEILMRCFPKIERLKVEFGFENTTALFRSGSEEVMKLWNGLKCLQLNGVERFKVGKFLVNFVKQDRHLEEITILYNRNIRDKTVETIIEHQGQNLLKFAISLINISRDCSLKLLVCHKLTHLSIFYPNNNITDEDLILILRGLTKLTFFEIECADKLFSTKSKIMFKDVALPKLVELIVSHCWKFRRDALKYFIRCSPLLKDITLQSLKKIEDEGLKDLIKVGGNLEMIHLIMMESITEECLKQISRELPNIREIVTDRCPKVSNGKICEIVMNQNCRLLRKHRRRQQ